MKTDIKSAPSSCNSEPSHNALDIPHGEPGWQTAAVYNVHDPILHLPRERDPSNTQAGPALNQARMLPNALHYQSAEPWLQADLPGSPEQADVMHHTIRVSVKKSRKAYKME